MGTFSKSLASCGGFLVGPTDVIEFLKLQSRAFLFLSLIHISEPTAPG